MGFFKDLRGVMKDAKDLEKQTGGRPSMREGMAQAKEAMATAKELADDQQAAAGGIPGQATIKAIRDTGMTLNENPVAEIDLEVEAGRGPPYEVTARQAIPRLRVGQIQPGATVEVKIDPDDPSKVTFA